MLVAVTPRWKTKILLVKLNEGCLLCLCPRWSAVPAGCVQARGARALFNRRINSVKLPMLLVPFSPSWLKLAVLVNGIRSSALETRTVPFVPSTSTAWASLSCHRGWLGWRGGEVPILHPKQVTEDDFFLLMTAVTAFPFWKFRKKIQPAFQNSFFFFLLLSCGYGLWLLVMY